MCYRKLYLTSSPSFFKILDVVDEVPSTWDFTTVLKNPLKPLYKSNCAVDDTYRIQYSRKPRTDQYGQMNRGSFQPNPAPKLV
jgi:hypothetical protein